MNALRTLLVVAAMTILTGFPGCDQVANEVNKRYPPVNVEQQRKQAIVTTANALAKLTAPNVAASVDLEDAALLLLTEDLKKQGVTALKIRAEDQLLFVTAIFKRTFTESDAGDENVVKELLSRLRPEVEGRVEIYVGITGAVVQEGSMSQLELKLLPGLSRVQLDSVRLAGIVNATSAGQWIFNLLNKYKDNITGQFADASFTKVSIPAMAGKPMDVSSALKIENQKGSVQVSVKTAPVTLPIKLEGIAWLAEGGQITAIAQLSPTAGVAASSPAKIDQTFSAIADQIEGFVESAFGIKEERKGSWAAVRKDLVGYVVNNSIAQASACVSVSGSTKERVEAKVPMPDPSSVSCSSDRNCSSSRVCSFDLRTDERPCYGCRAHAPRLCDFWGNNCIGGGCVIMADEPFCALAKTAQNALYLKEANERKAACDTTREAETGFCKVEEAGKVALCQGGKTVLAELQKTGNFANVDVDSNITANDIKICMQDFHLSPGLEKVSLALNVSGDATAELDVKFTPLDIVGHLACQFPWQEKKTFQVKLTEPNIRVETALKFVLNIQQPKLDFTIGKSTVEGKVSPGPTEYLLTSPAMAVSCAGLNMLKPLVVTLTPFIPVLQGKVKHEVEQQSGSIDIAMPSQKVAGKSVVFKPRETSKALVLMGVAQ